MTQSTWRWANRINQVDAAHEHHVFKVNAIYRRIDIEQMAPEISLPCVAPMM